MGGDAGHRDHQVARALADAFLAADWTTAGLLDAGAVVLGARRRWLRPVAALVLAGYRSPPKDAPRELTAVIATAGPFVEAARAARERGRPLRAVRLIPSGTAMGRSRWPVPELGDLGALGALLDLDQHRLAWLADGEHRQRRTPAGPLHAYRYRWLAHPGRPPRLLEVPAPRLRRVQRVLLDRVLGLIPAHGAAHGFVPGRSALSGARHHVGQAVVLTLDLSAFFATVTAGRVYAVARAAGYPEPVAHCLAGLCTTATPVAVIAAMPPGGSPEQRAHLRRHLAAGHLPQGAATSPQLANLAAFRLDARLSGYAVAAGASYTRYADDLTLSGGRRVRGRADAIVATVSRIAADEGFRLNVAKTRVRHRGERQQVTGIVVNEQPNLPRGDYDRLKAILFNAVRAGPAGQNRDAVTDFRAHLVGRVSWCEQVSPDRGRRLRALLDQVEW
jgi:hypothetical protein